SASRTSVRWRWRTSVARRSTSAPATARVASRAAWRSRATTWVGAGSGARPSSSRTSASISAGRLAEVPTAPEMVPTATPSRPAARPGPDDRHLDLDEQPEAGRLAPDGAHLGQRVAGDHRALQPQALGQLVLELLELEPQPGVADGQDLHGQDAGVGGGVQPDG